MGFPDFVRTVSDFFLIRSPRDYAALKDIPPPYSERPGKNDLQTKFPPKSSLLPPCEIVRAANNNFLSSKYPIVSQA